MSFITRNIHSQMGTFKKPREQGSLKTAALQLFSEQHDQEQEKIAEPVEAGSGELLVDVVCNNDDARSMFKKVSAKDDKLVAVEGRPFLK